MSSPHDYFGKTDKELVDHILEGSRYTPATAQSAAIAEMQRRLLEAIREFNKTSTGQARTMIWLTVVIALLTVAMVAVAYVQWSRMP